MGIDDELRAAQAETREREQRAKEHRAERSTLRASYHAKEAALSEELVAAARRTLVLLVERRSSQLGKNQGIARNRFRWRRSRGEWEIPDPVDGHARRILREDGSVVSIQPRCGRSEASSPIRLEDWIELEIKRARVEIVPGRPFADSRTNYYDLAFVSYSQLGYVKEMERQLVQMRARVMKTLSQMLTEAGIKL